MKINSVASRCLVAVLVIAFSISVGCFKSSGGKKDTMKSLENLSFAELEKRASGGDAEAQFAVGLNYDIGKRVPKDSEKAIEWLQKAAFRGHAEAQYVLGLMYLRAPSSQLL